MYIYVGVDPERKYIYALQSTHIEQRVSIRWKVVVNIVCILYMHVQCIYMYSECSQFPNSTYTVPGTFLSGLNILPLLLPYPREGERTGREREGGEGEDGKGGRKVRGEGGEGGNKTKDSKTKTNTHLECFS